MRDYEAVLKQARTCANQKYCDLGGNCEYYDLDVCCQGGEKDILKDAADAIEELLAAVPKWISVEERLPEKHTVVLFYIPWIKSNMIGWIGEDGNLNLEGYGICYDFSLVKPSHWMPLPELQKEVE